jgi:tetratricopeptide (TPR) repeat protein
MYNAENKYQVFLIYSLLVLSTLIAYEQVRKNSFVDYDDLLYITRNQHIKTGINFKNITWAFTATYAGNWHPVTWLSHILDCQVFGLNPKWHHLVNLLFHTANTLLLFWVLKKMTGAIWQSAFVAAAFALHPLHVESVAWVAERKDVLSALFWLLTMAAYLRYVRGGGAKWYVGTLLLFALGLMAKPMLVTLPFVLLLLDYWPLNRLKPADSVERVADRKEASEIHYTPNTIRYTLPEKVPFFALSVISSVITFLAQQSDRAMAGADTLALRIRFANAVVSYLRYIGKMVWPSKLAVLYPYHIDRLLFSKAAAAVLVLLAVSIPVLRLASRHRYLPVGWFWYLGTLVPVIGLVQVGSQTFADRYTYMPSVGIFIMAAWGAAELTSRWKYRKILLGITASLVLTGLLITTRAQVRYWQNSISLFKHALAVTGNNPLMQDNLAFAFHTENNVGEAVKLYREIIRQRPNNFRAYNHLAWFEATQTDPNISNPMEALALAMRACEMTDYNEPYCLDTLAAAYASTGKFSEAAAAAEKAQKSAESAGNQKLVEEVRHRLQLYKTNQPYHEK